MACPICRTRTVKRACPVIGEQICPVCCATKRIVEFACPATCVYLDSAQKHPAAVVRRQQEADLARLLQSLGPVSEPQLQLFFLVHTFIARFKPDEPARLGDISVAEAAGALAESFETASRGVLYEPQAPSLAGESLRRALKTFLAEAGRSGGSRFEREAALVLRGIERGGRLAPSTPGGGGNEYLSLVARILHERPPGTAQRPSILLP